MHKTFRLNLTAQQERCFMRLQLILIFLIGLDYENTYILVYFSFKTFSKHILMQTQNIAFSTKN